jgi:protein-L-isoaspartate O-methyltransferase
MFSSNTLKYSVTIFLSAFLLFQIQPMIAKMILPWFGGSAAVWITCMLFFQVVLLGGYVYAHMLISWFGVKGQVVIHSVLLLMSLLFLPIAPGLDWKPSGGEEPALRILGLLATSVGLPYFLLSTTSPLLQAWYAQSSRAALPYRLFALSNFASLLGLLAYPFLIEPLASLHQQSLGWSTPYALFVVMGLALSIGHIRKKGDGPACDAPEPSAATGHGVLLAPAPSFREKLLWLALAACASLLLLSVTSHLTQNIASIPFLWILPLCLYLLTFILCFERSGWYHRKVYLWLIVASVGLMSYGLVDWGPEKNLMLVLPVFCVGLFLCCMFCHGELAGRKPAPCHLTSFYLHLSLGGALGGIMAGLLAPSLFSGYFELIGGLLLCALLLFLLNFRRSWLAAGLCGLLLAGTVTAGVLYIHDYASDSLINLRNFYGTLRVREYSVQTDDQHRSLIHGAINHGSQFTEPEKRQQPLTYYSDTSGVGRAILQLQKRGPVKVGVIGLGTGTLAAYARESDLVRFYEINPTVEEIARDYFYYLGEAKGQVDVVIGDGRLSLERERPQDYDLLAVDAFSSDSIPVHLLTEQALGLYFRHLKQDGVLAIHISNKHLDLEPVVAKLCAALRKKCLVIDEDRKDHGQVFGSKWVLISSDKKSLELSDADEGFGEPVSREGMKIWTDDYSNLYQTLKK